ncbi:hypothetical protein HK405_000500 [Cladochytrium tenue]|nr:hypothetical protein HK405_000500 [Cladochytrium tenue]
MADTPTVPPAASVPSQQHQLAKVTSRTPPPPPPPSPGVAWDEVRARVRAFHASAHAPLPVARDFAWDAASGQAVFLAVAAVATNHAAAAAGPPEAAHATISGDTTTAITTAQSIAAQTSAPGSNSRFHHPGFNIPYDNTVPACSNLT